MQQSEKNLFFFRTWLSRMESHGQNLCPQKLYLNVYFDSTMNVACQTFFEKLRAKFSAQVLCKGSCKTARFNNKKKECFS